MKHPRMSLPLALALAAALAASPAEAQQGNGNGRARVELREDRWDDREEREERRYERRDRDDRREGRAERRDRRVPPGWCKGRGNPHNTPENCGYRRDSREDRRWEDRRDDRRDGSWGDRRDGDYSSYEEAHARFHRELERRCSIREAEAGGLLGRARVRAECSAEHQAWHRERGVPHR